VDRLAASEKGAGSKPRKCNNERALVRFDRKIEVEPMKGVPVRVMPSF